MNVDKTVFTFNSFENVRTQLFSTEFAYNFICIKVLTV